MKLLLFFMIYFPLQVTAASALIENNLLIENETNRNYVIGTYYRLGAQTVPCQSWYCFKTQFTHFVAEDQNFSSITLDLKWDARFLMISGGENDLYELFITECKIHSEETLRTSRRRKGINIDSELIVKLSSLKKHEDEPFPGRELCLRKSETLILKIRE